MGKEKNMQGKKCARKRMCKEKEMRGNGCARKNMCKEKYVQVQGHSFVMHDYKTKYLSFQSI